MTAQAPAVARYHHVRDMAERVQLLHRMALQDAERPEVMTLARHAVGWGVTRGASYAANAHALCDAVRDLVTYTRTRGEVVQPWPWLAQAPAGDCDQMVQALASLLLATGWSVRYVVAMGARGGHIWCEAMTPGRCETWQTLDPTLAPGENPYWRARGARITAYAAPENAG